MYKSFKSFHSYLYFIDLLIITWKTMCSQICSHWLLLRSSHLVFSLIMIQTLWKKKIIYKHVQRYDNYFYQVWRFLNIRFCDSSKSIRISYPTLILVNICQDLIHWMLQIVNCFKFRFLLCYLDIKPHFCLVIMINTIFMYTSTHTWKCGIFHRVTIQMINNWNNTCDLWPRGTTRQYSYRWRWQGHIFGVPGFPWTNEWWPVGSRGYRRLGRTQV